MRFLILGPLEVRGERGAVVLGGNRLRGLLAVLVLHANESVSAERLALALWGDDASSGASKAVQVHVWRLRQALGGVDVIATTPAGYCLRASPDELDVAQFERLVEDGRRARADGRPGRAAALLREALALWRGPALGELACEPFAAAEVARLEEQRLAALEARIEADLAMGGHTAVVGELRRLVVVNPTRECLTGLLMLALYRCGRQGDALEAFARARAYLSGELGLEPGPALQSLQADILCQSPALQLVSDGSGFAAGADRLGQGAVAVAVGPIVVALPRALHAVARGFPFVGREAQLARLREHWTEIEDRGRAAVVIGGEAGIGKTRLASELAREVHGEGALVLYGRCDEGLAVPYQPFVEALAPYARAVGLDRLRGALGHRAPELGRMLPELAALGEPLRADPESERFALFDAITALIEAMTRQQRALLIVDDLHWAAPPTLLLLRHLIRSERALNVLVLCTYRETELDLGESLAQLLADLQRDASAQRLSIGGLDEHAIAVLLAAVTGQALDERDADLVQLVRSQTGGNAFFVSAFLAHLCELGAIDRPGQRRTYDLHAAEQWVPAGLEDVICQRVARLSQPARRALSLGAVAGPSFSLALLEHVIADSEDVLGALDEALAAGLLTEAGPATYAFAHALVRQVLYAALSAARRMRLHRQLGEALEALGTTEARVETLAYHFAQAAADGQGAKAAHYALAAGHSATARLGYEEAAAHYERGLQALSSSGQSQPHRHLELLLALGDARWGAGEPDTARQACGQGAELAEQFGDATALARAALGFCGPHRFEAAAAMTERAADLLRRALSALPDTDSSLRAQLMGRLAAALAFSGVEHRPRLLTRQALEMARRVTDGATLADVLASTHWVTHGPDTVQESLTRAEELGHVADEIGDRRLRALAHWRLLDTLLELGDIESVWREFEALQRLAEGRRERFFTWILTVFRANEAFLRGRLEDCETLAHAALAHSFEGYDESAAHIFGGQMLHVRDQQGRLAELVDAIESRVGQYPQLPSWRCGLAYIYVQLEHRAQARRELDALAHADFEDLPRDVSWLPTLATLSEAVVFLDDAPRAQLLYNLLLPYGDRCAVVFALLCEGSVSRPLGQLATTLSRYEDAERHFDQALTMNTHISSPILIAHTQHDYARMLLLRNHPGDHDKALQLLGAALATADELGLKALADKARPLRLSAEAARPAAVVPRPD